ncbi:CpaF family protein [Micavibrio aeruginosavorus]|uniref:Type II/IV secretion system ATP hydrolase TadA/VirB11/CpaF, TadA subfamily n=1 Tax=Micavibrio aeruginosavorus EPB TaxID=349215 RepID=M4VH14_9BACT|nr:CpaF family protein [Micavibrio aeruginosavorus]AGH97346.1 Type II/IV secretion system ATP hydrolase TadA/VirB11/CpaF, TadA subfamily [Micavibrio aeruginosavorus EPB]
MFGKKGTSGPPTPPPAPSAPRPEPVATTPAPEKIAQTPPPAAKEVSSSTMPPMDADMLGALNALNAEKGTTSAGQVHIPAVEAEKAKPAKALDDDLLPKTEESTVKTESGASMASVRLQRARNRIWLDLRDGIDLKALARMDAKAAREEVASAVQEIARFRNLDITPSELDLISKECSDDMLGYGPLEALLERDDIADIMINGPETTYIEVSGKIQRTDIKFRDNQHLTTICQRIVGAIGRRVDESSPICDARLPDGSRVNVIIPPLAVDGATMTIRKFKKDKLTLEKLVEFGAATPSCAKLIMAVGRCRVNVLVSGGTGSGKTTMLNCLTRYIESGERIITCEDACELQLQQPHVVRLETRPPNLEGAGEVTMRDLVKNCLRMRPERIIVGEVRGPEAFDLLQAMNTGHDGSMGTVHANNPREALSRMENMIAMGGLNLPSSAVREQIASAVNVIIQVQRLRDGSRKVTHISEITGMEGDVVTMQDLFQLEYLGEDDDGKLITRQKSTGLRPKFYDKARQYGVEQLVLDAMAEAFG